jgi:hypothetical protein
MTNKRTDNGTERQTNGQATAIATGTIQQLQQKQTATQIPSFRCGMTSKRAGNGKRNDKQTHSKGDDDRSCWR